jgi:peptide/nickel transport system substrate-binding protein
MKLQRPVLTALASALLCVAGCGSDNGNAPATSGLGAAASSAAAATSKLPEPPDGVPAGTRPLPMPEFGKAYNNPQPRSNVEDGGTLTLPIGEFGPNFNRFHVDGNNGDVTLIMNWLAPRIWDFTAAGESSPNGSYLLSAELISETPETIKYVLNPRAKWNDGTPIDWLSFDATWKIMRGGDDRYASPATAGYESIASVAKGEQDNEVIVTLKEPYYPFEVLFAELSHPKNVDPDFYKTGWINQLHPELLAGAFTVASLSEDRLVLERNPSWWGEPAKLERVVYRKMELASSINAFQNGEIDATNVAIADRLEQISHMTNIQIRRAFDTRNGVYVMGMDSDLFKDDAARKAFMLGVDRRLIATIDNQGLDWEEEAPGSTAMFAWQRGYRDNMPDLHYDPQQAKQILDAAGWTVGDDGYRHRAGQAAEFTYVDFGDDPLVAAKARALQKMTKDIGLRMQIDIRKSSDFAPTLNNASYDVINMTFSATDPFGYAWVCQVYCSDSGFNKTGLGNKELDELLRRPGRMADRAKAIEAANDAEAEALHLFGVLPLAIGPKMTAVKRGLANVGPAGFMVPHPEDIGWQKNPGGTSDAPGSGAR